MTDTSVTHERKVSAVVPLVKQLSCDQKRVYGKLRAHMSREDAMAEAMKPFVVKPSAMTVAPSTLDRADAIVRAVGEAFDVTPDVLRGPRRSRYIAWPRFAVVALMDELCPEMSLPGIGRILNRDHTTIMYASQRAAVLLQEDSEWTERYYAARSRLTVGP